MALATLDDYLDATNRPKLTQAVIEQIGMAVDWHELVENISDYQDASSGIPGFIYYSETVEFTKENFMLIMQALHEFENDCGLVLNKPSDDETQYYNWLAWFALEHVMHDLESWLEAYN